SADEELTKGKGDSDRAVTREASETAESEALRARGFMRLQQGDWRGAIDDETVALARNPIHAPALYIRGLAELKGGNVAIGKSDVDRAKSWHAEVADDFADWIR